MMSKRGKLRSFNREMILEREEFKRDRVNIMQVNTARVMDERVKTKRLEKTSREISFSRG